MKAMILAAGLGTRLRPYSDHRPKPLFPILGKPLITYILEQLSFHGLSPVIVNAHYLKEQFVELLSGRSDVILQLEETVLGTGGGLRLALLELDDSPLLVVNGDTLHDLDLGYLYRQHLETNCPVTMVVHDRPRFNNLRVTAEGLVAGFRVTEEEVCRSRGERLLAFAGIHILDPAVLREMPEDGFFDIIDLYKFLVESGAGVNTLEVKSHFWTDIGSPGDYLDLHGSLLTSNKESLPDFLVPGGGPVLVSDKAEIGRGVVFEDWAWIGEGAKVGDGSRICRSVVWPGAEVAKGREVRDEIVTA